MKDILRLTLKVLSRQKRRLLSFCLFCLLLFLFLSLFWSAHIHIRQGLEDNLYQNLYNRMVWVDSGETVDANFWDSLGKLPHAEGVLPNLSGLYCTGLDAQAAELSLTPCCGEEKMRITAGRALTTADTASILLPAAYFSTKTGSSIPFASPDWVGRQVQLTVSDYQGNRVTYQVHIKGIYNGEQIYFKNKGIYLSPTYGQSWHNSILSLPCI